MNGSTTTAALRLPAAAPAMPAPRPRGELVTMSLGDPLDPRIRRSLESVAALPYVDSVLALPDAHWKAQMEVPSSIAIATRDVLVPEFTSADVNDGMGVVATGLEVGEATPARLESFFRRINAHAAAHVLDRNRYSLSGEDLMRAIREGAAGVLTRYGWEPALLEAFEDEGGVSLDADGTDAVRAAVPAQLLAGPFSRCEMGLNFGGNHFLEVQAVDAVLDPAAAARWGLRAGQVVVMYHLGPGPFAGTLLHHYARRLKLKPRRVPLFFLSKLLFHVVQRGGRGGLRRLWELHFRRNGVTPFPARSEEGALLAAALALASNFGSAYRVATVRAITDALDETLGRDAGARLVCDVAHNGIQEERHRGGSLWVARHNACRLSPGRPAIVAGSYDVPSYLGVGGEGDGGRYHSYDHGAGHLIDEYRREERLAAARGAVLRFRMSRGRRGGIESRTEAPLRTAEPVDRLLECLERHDVVRRAVRLRPLATLKN